jgi:hypothetical protein
MDDRCEASHRDEPYYSIDAYFGCLMFQLMSVIRMIHRRYISYGLKTKYRVKELFNLGLRFQFH